ERPFDHGDLRGRDERLLPWPRTPKDVREELALYAAGRRQAAWGRARAGRRRGSPLSPSSSTRSIALHVFFPVRPGRPRPANGGNRYCPSPQPATFTRMLPRDPPFSVETVDLVPGRSLIPVGFPVGLATVPDPAWAPRKGPAAARRAAGTSPFTSER